MTKLIYKVNLYGGYVGLIAAPSLEAAKRQAMSEQGSSNVQNVELASSKDLEWVKAMGGPVPSTEPAKRPSEWAREGYFVIEKWTPKPGAECDYYDREGNKRHGTVKAFDGQRIWINGEKTVIVEETFLVRYGR